MDEVAEICPRCGRNEVEPQAPSGFCSPCVVERIREAYGERQRVAVLSRREAWRNRTTNEWERDRQRVSRLQRAVKPREPAESFDPWELAYDALRELKSLRSVRMRAEHYERLERIAEAIRRLGWGPDDAPRATHVPRESPEPLLARLNPSEPI